MSECPLADSGSGVHGPPFGEISGATVIPGVNFMSLMTRTSNQASITLCCSVDNGVIGGFKEAPEGRSEDALIEVLLIGVPFVMLLRVRNCHKGLVFETQLVGQRTVVAWRANGFGVECCALLTSLSSTAAATSSNTTMFCSTALELSRERSPPCRDGAHLSAAATGGCTHL